MSKTVAQKLDEAYRDIPAGFCKGHCWPTCGPLTMTQAEYDRCSSHAEPRRNPEDALQCPFLGEDHKCRVYPVRPLICRALGASPALPCHYGCKMPKKAVSSRALKRLFEKVESFGGPNVHTHPEMSERIRALLPVCRRAGMGQRQAWEITSQLCQSDAPTEDIVRELTEALAR